MKILWQSGHPDVEAEVQLALCPEGMVRVCTSQRYLNFSAAWWPFVVVYTYRGALNSNCSNCTAVYGARLR